MALHTRFKRILPSCFAVVISSGTLSLAQPAPVAHPDGVAGSVTLAQAMELALSRSPILMAGEAAVEAAAGRGVQAGLRPNPELEIEVEDVGVTGDERGLDASIFVVRAAQTFERGGKRAKRRRAALIEVELARWDAGTERLDLMAAVKTRFVDLLAAQERVRMVFAAHELGSKVRNVAAERVKSGKVSPLELTKADVELTGRRVELRRAERELSAARSALALLWNAPISEAGKLRAEGSIRDVPELPGLAALEAALANNPDVARWPTEEELAQAVVDQERAAPISDVTLSAAVAHERESGSEVVEFAVSVPLPLFDRNQGNIAAALAEQEGARQGQLAVALALRAELAGEWQELQATKEEAASIENEMLPGARRAFEAAQQGYRSGKFEYLDVLDAQQTLFEGEMQLLEALSDLRQTAVRIERLVGGSLRSQGL
ncbi:MAG: TolC family protein [Lentisphaerae bacterium]|jgi:outer membrane protein, heavy metal efflux system|nr:TolC family protein [Lentisphaerota bacterium]MBT5606217.1 TolC family protein [Lentisphaerota bacterium]MBT7060393.1 TolC family protein [Lentisphaerota bacterium]MBT7844753.1 TolC family protein [Lentisphaerota bacterium]